MSIPVALVVAAGAATGRPLGRVDVARRDELVTLARAVPEPDRPGVLSVAECLFARLDPAWAWAQIVDLVGAESAVRAAVGLDVAAHLALDWNADWWAGCR